MTTLELQNDKQALIDSEDLFRCLERGLWSIGARGYVATNLQSNKRKGFKRLPEYLARFIMNAPPGTHVDHINHNPLDNRKSNLRVCDSAMNQGNRKHTKSQTTSRYKGVIWDKSRNKWQAKIKVNYKTVHLGRFLHEVEAAEAYNKAAIERFGSFALLNDLAPVCPVVH